MYDGGLAWTYESSENERAAERERKPAAEGEKKEWRREGEREKERENRAGESARGEGLQSQSNVTDAAQ